MIMQATVTKEFRGVEDGKVYPRKFEIGDTVKGSLAAEVVRSGWASTDAVPAPVVSEPIATEEKVSEVVSEVGAPTDVVEIPDEWRSMKWFALKALAEKVGGDPVADAAEAKSVIEAELARRA